MNRYTAQLVFCFVLLFQGSLRADSRDPSNMPFLRSFARFFSADLRDLDRHTEALLGRLQQLPLPRGDQQSERLGFHSRFSSEPDSATWLQVDLGEPEPLDAIVLIPCHVAYGAHPGPGYGFPTRLRVEISNQPDFGIATVLLDSTAADFPNPGNLPVLIPAGGRSARYIRLIATQLWNRGDQYLLALGELMALQGNLNLAAGAPVTSPFPYDNAPAWAPANATDGQSVLGPPVLDRASPGNGYHSTEAALHPDTNGWVQVDLGTALPIDEVRLFPARPRDFPARRGFGFPVRFRIEAANEPDFSNPFLIVDQTAHDFINPAENPVAFRAAAVRARFVRMTATRWWLRNHDYVFALAEMAVYSNGTNAALGRPVRSLNRTQVITWGEEMLVDGCNSQGTLAEWPDWLGQLSERRTILDQLARLDRDEAILASAVMTRAAQGLGAASLGLALVSVPLVYRMRLKRMREVEALRARIASDLHDEIGSNLGSIALLSRIMQDAETIQRDGRQTFTEINRTASETLDSMREIVWLIHPGHDRAEDLVERFRDFAGRMLSGIHFEFDAPPHLARRLSLDFRRNAFLIYKEILHNLVKHSHATEARITLVEHPSHLRIEVSDNGLGFAPGIEKGFGMETMRERARHLRGKIALESSPDKGTRILLELPWK